MEHFQVAKDSWMDMNFDMSDTFTETKFKAFGLVDSAIGVVPRNHCKLFVGANGSLQMLFCGVFSQEVFEGTDEKAAKD